jgi:hypothetical protein
VRSFQTGSDNGKVGGKGEKKGEQEDTPDPSSSSPLRSSSSSSSTSPRHRTRNRHRRSSASLSPSHTHADDNFTSIDRLPSLSSTSFPSFSFSQSTGDDIAKTESCPSSQPAQDPDAEDEEEGGFSQLSHASQTDLGALDGAW